MKNSISVKRLYAVCLLAVAGISIAFAQQRYLAEHPRLLFTKAEEPALKELIKSDSQAHELADFLKSNADSLINAPQIPYSIDKYGQLLWISRAYVNRLGTLALMYRLTGDKKYADAVNETLLWVCAYPDWNPAHYLDTAEMSAAVAIAYDWLWDVLPQTTKDVVKHTLSERALARVLREYETGGPGSWAKRETNWNVVCNTGMTLAALAIAEDYPQEAATILDNAAKYMPNCLKHFSPDGVCYEGPAYWNYTTTYLSAYLKAVADNDNGRGGIAQLPGLDKTALYSKRTLTPAGRVFNFANASKDPSNTSAYFFFSKYYDQPEVAEWYRNELRKVVKDDMTQNQMFFLSLPWFDTASATDSHVLPPLDVYHNGINDIIVLNGDRSKEGSLFLIAKGGTPNQAHQQMDCGTFLVESDGICWTEDLGSDDYALPGFWDYKVGGQRWNYFRNNNFSHNTINIDHKLQNAEGHAFVCEENPDAAAPSARLDMSSLYGDKAESVMRKYTLVDDRTIEIEDEIRLKDPKSVVSWVVATAADVTVNVHGAQLTQDGKRFFIKVSAPAGVRLKTYPAATSYEGEKPITGITMLEAECALGDSGEGKIRVSLGSRSDE